MKRKWNDFARSGIHTIIEGRDGGFTVKNYVATYFRAKISMCGTISATSMMSFFVDRDMISRLFHKKGTDENERRQILITLPHRADIKQSWTRFYHGFPKASDRSFQAFTIFLVCCANIGIHTYVATPPDLGYGNHGLPLGFYHVMRDGTTQREIARSGRVPSVLVFAVPPPQGSVPHGFSFIGIMVDIFRTSSPGHTVSVQVVNGGFTLYDADDHETKSFNLEKDVYLHLMATYALDTNFDRIRTQYVYFSKSIISSPP